LLYDDLDTLCSGILENVKIILEKIQFTERMKVIALHEAIPNNIPVITFPAPIPIKVEVPSKARDFVFFSEG
jgi:hypothetical protein